MVDFRRFQPLTSDFCLDGSAGPPSRLLLSDYLSRQRHGRYEIYPTGHRREVSVNPSNLDRNTRLDVLCRARMIVAMQSGVLTGPNPCRGTKLRFCIIGTSINHRSSSQTRPDSICLMNCDIGSKRTSSIHSVEGMCLFISFHLVAFCLLYYIGRIELSGKSGLLQFKQETQAACDLLSMSLGFQHG
jgi:hypothetical protein